MKLTKSLFLSLFFALTLSACSLNTGTKTGMDSPKQVDEQGVSQLSPTPTLAADNSLDSIEADLKNTTILEEDFSDLD
jgi:hypothetical protein